MNSNTPAPKNQPEISPISSESDWKPGHGMVTSRLVAVEDIIADDLYQMRVQGTDPAVAEKYAAIMEENNPDGWAQFPPIRVLTYETEDNILKYKIVSGFHRHAAILQNGYDEIQVELVYGEELDGIILALGQNTDRSQPRTQDDIKTMMEFCLTHPEIRLWSNGQIARWCAVSRQTVLNHENRLIKASKLDAADRPDDLKYIDKHGNVSLRKRSMPKDEKTIYKTTNTINGKSYVGKTNNAKKRIPTHFKGEGNRLLQEDLEKYGRDAFVDEILYENVAHHDADALESQAIRDHNALQPNGYNIEASSQRRELYVDAEQVEIEQLQRDITNTFIGSIRPFIFSTHPNIFAQREAALIEEYPILELYPRLTSLGLEDLRGFSENLKKVDKELDDRKSNLRKECEGLRRQEIHKQFPTLHTTYEEDEQWQAALEAAFVGYSQYQSLWSLSYYELADLQAVMLKIVEHLKENGVDAYLPKSYTDRITDEAKTESKNAKQKELAAAAVKIREEVNDAIIKIAGAEDLSLSKEQMAVSIFRSAFNKAQPDDAMSKDKANQPRWDMEELTVKEIKVIKAYWQKMKEVCRFYGVAETSRPSWIDDAVRSFRCQLSSIKITGSRDYQSIGKEITIVPESPLSDDESAEVVKAAQEAAKEKAMDIHLRHTCGTDGEEEADFDIYLSCRDKAFKAWKAYCSKWGIEGNWESVCLEAEKHCGGEGSASLIQQDASPDLIREKVQFWQKLLSAIEEEPDWIYAYRKPLAGLTREERRAKNDEGKPDTEVS